MHGPEVFRINRGLVAGNVTGMTRQDLNEPDNKTIAGQIVGYARVSSAGQNLGRGASRR